MRKLKLGDVYRYSRGKNEHEIISVMIGKGRILIQSTPDGLTEVKIREINMSVFQTLINHDTWELIRERQYVVELPENLFTI